MSWFTDLLDGLKKNLTNTLRKFVAFSVLMFFFGALYGAGIALIAAKFSFPDPLWLLLLPLIIAVLAYFSTEFAAFIFLLMLGLLLFVFI
ncbi:MAG: hypothetical protein ABH803_00370 [Candidatus Micrarchaeota archaeon]